MKTLIFVSNPECFSPKVKGRADTEIRIVPITSHSISWCKKNGISYIDFAKYMNAVDNDEIARKTFSFLFKWENTKFFDGKSIIEFVSKDKISLWWVLRRPFYHWIFESVKLSRFLSNIIESEKPDSVLGDDSGNFSRILEDVCRKESVNVRIVPQKKSLFKKITARLNYWRELLNLYFVTVLRVIQGSLRFRKFLKLKYDSNVFILTNSFYWQLTKDTYTKKSMKDDVHFGAVARLLMKNNIGVIAADLPKKAATAWKSFREKKYPFIPWEYFLFNGMIDSRIRNKVSALKKELAVKWNILQNNAVFRKSLIIGGVDLWRVYRSEFYNYFSKSIGSLASFYRNIEIGRKIINKAGIKVCFVTDEMGSGLHIVFASRISGIKSVGMQHGIFGEISPNIIYAKDEICCHGIEEGKCILPDYTIVYGPYFRNMLAKNNYPEDSVVVCGNPRSDIAFYSRSIYDKNAVYHKYSIDKSKKIIMLATSRNENKFESLPIVESAYRAVSGMDGVQLIHKLHPSEHEDILEYKKLMRDLNVNVILLRENVDLYEIINASDIVVSWLATSVVAESLLFEKPVITVDIGAKIDALGYKAADVVINIGSAENLEKAIRDTLKNSGSLAKKYSAKRKKFIAERFNSVDGNVSKGIAEFIGRLASNGSIFVRNAAIADAGRLSELVINTIKKINSHYSSPEQVNVWIKRNSREQIERKLKDKSRENFVAVLDSEVVGYATISKNKILNLYVNAGLTGKGIGKLLLEHMEGSILKRDYRKIVLESTLAARDFYFKNGYKYIKNIYKEVEGVKFHSIRMEKLFVL